MNDWTTVKTVCYDGRYDGRNCDRRACGAVVHIQIKVVGNREYKRAVTTNGRFSFVTDLGFSEKKVD